MMNEMAGKKGNGDGVGISVILPTYDERDNIIDLINEIDYYLNRYVKESLEFIVVDDDSPDGTWEVVQNYFRDDPRLRVIRRTKERGLASAISRGILESRGKIIAWMDCDFSMPAYNLAELVNQVLRGYDVAVASRFVKGGRDIRGPTDSWLQVFSSRIMNGFISFWMGPAFKDYTSGFVAVRREVFDKITIKGDYGEYFIDFIFQLQRAGYKIIELPYYCLPRRKGYSKTGANLIEYLKHGWRYILLVLKLRIKTR